MMLLSDFHIHSNFSDGKHSIAEIIDFYGERGFGSIAITDHLCESNTLLGKAAAYLEHTLTPHNFDLYLDTLEEEGKRALKQYGMIVIPGIEITKNSLSNHRSAHILALNIKKFISANDSIESILKAIREQGALSVAAHPVPTRKFEKQTLHLWSRRHELAPLFDAWEVASGSHLFEEVLHSGLPLIANSDLHRFSQINAYKTLVDSVRETEAILQAIREQKIKFHFYYDSSLTLENQPHLIQDSA